MTTLQTLEMALEAFEIAAEGGGVNFYEYAKQLRQQIALEKKAENERELGIQMQPDEPFGYFQYSIRMDAWVQNRDSNKGAAFYTRPQPAAWVGLMDEERRAEFAKLYPADDALLNLAENDRDFMVEAIGARYHWHAFQLGSKVTEAKLKEKNT